MERQSERNTKQRSTREWKDGEKIESFREDKWQSRKRKRNREKGTFPVQR